MRSSYQLARSLAYVLVGFVLLASAGRDVKAQELDSRGREFWIAFMSNLGSTAVSDLRLYLSSQKPTTARITWAYDGRSITVPIPQANKTVEVNINGAFGPLVELDDVPTWDPSSEKSQKGLHIEADDEIAVVGLNYRGLSADAFLALPADVLSGEYVVVSHRNGFSSFGGSSSYDTPSQFCVVGMHAGTTVRVLPRQGVHINGRADDAPFVITLDAGDVFFGQAQVDIFTPYDVTGTQIIASKPVSVFGGVKRASIPTWWGNYRDHLVEQLPPLQNWGRNALVTPHYKVFPGNQDTAEYRVTSAFGPTDVTITGSVTSESVTMGAGEVLERPLLEAASITASGPILVTQYERSTPTGGGNQSSVGDPFMMIIPPVEQFDTSYTVQSIGFAEFLDDQHFLNLVAPVNGAATITVDGANTGATWTAIPGSRFVYTQLRVPPGAHNLRADSPFAVYAYGYGYAVSYGYPGAMVFRRLVKDVSPPEILWSQQCGLFQGIATDSRIADSGIDSIYATADTVNVQVDIPPFMPDADTVFFTARLIDPFNDGVVAVKVIDSSGLSYSQKTGIPGFTLGVNGRRDGAVLVDTVVAINSNEFCKRLTIVNYGRFPQRIIGFHLLDSIPGAHITTPTPMVIDTGSSGVVEICFSGLLDTTFTTRLELEGVCSNRLAAIIPVDSRIDTSAPGIGREGAPCADEIVLVYTKEDRASKIASVEVDTLINCTSEILNDPSTLPLQLVRVRLRRDDSRYDMIYQITVVDSVGNTIVDRDTLGGFSIAAVDRTRDSLGIRWDKEWEGDTLMTSSRTCGSIELVNFGSQPVNVSRVRLRGNIKYSVPPSQLPLLIPPGESRQLTVCMQAPYPYDQLDTLELWDFCGHAEVIALKTPSSILLGAGTDGCQGRIEVSVYEAAKRTFMTPPVPNPMRSDGYVDIGLTQDELVTLEVFDLRGNRVATIARNALLPAGVMRLTYSLGSLEAGAFVLRMTTARGESIVQRGVRER